jgi:hypothetical protein
VLRLHLVQIEATKRIRIDPYGDKADPDLLPSCGIDRIKHAVQSEAFDDARIVSAEYGIDTFERNLT